MINLLPPELKTGYRYGRRNIGMRKWVAVLVITLVGVGALATYGLVTLRQSNQQYASQVAATQAQLQKDKLNQTKEQVQDISNSLKLAVKVLGNEVLFSKLIQQIGAVMPNGTVLTGLTIDQVTGGLELQAASTNYDEATQIQVNLADPTNKLFSKVDINSINCTETANSGNYPCAVDLRSLFNTNNPFLFINGGKPS
jgi:hypothetical protein